MKKNLKRLKHKQETNVYLSTQVATSCRRKQNTGTLVYNFLCGWGQVVWWCMYLLSQNNDSTLFCFHSLPADGGRCSKSVFPFRVAPSPFMRFQFVNQTVYFIFSWISLLQLLISTLVRSVSDAHIIVSHGQMCPKDTIVFSKTQRTFTRT